MSPRNPPTRRFVTAVAQDLGAAFLFALLALFVTRPLYEVFNTHILSGIDPLIDLWTVDWLTENFFRPSQLLHGNIFFPSPHAILYSDLSLGTAIWLVPFRTLLSDPVPLYNAAVLVALTFAGWGFYALVRHLTGSWGAGILTGILAGFGSHQLSHVYHLNLISIGWLGALLWGLHMIRDGLVVRGASVAGVSLALCIQTSGYYAVIGAGFLALFAATNAKPFLEKRRGVALLGSVLLAAVLAGPFIWNYLELREAEGLRRPLGMSVTMAFQPSRDLGSQAYVYRWLGTEGERLFPGFLTLVLLAITAWRRVPGLRFYWLGGFIFLVLSLGPYLEIGTVSLPLPYRALFELPAMDSMRHPYTFAAAALFLLSVVAGVGFAHLSAKHRLVITPIVLAVAILEVWGPGPAFKRTIVGMPDRYLRISELPPGPILELPVFSPEALLLAARHSYPVVNGHGSAFVPAKTLILERMIDTHWLEVMPDDVDASKPMAYLREHFPIRYLLLRSTEFGSHARVATALLKSRYFELIEDTADGSRLYQVTPAFSSLSGDHRTYPSEERPALSR